jgi:hypothetical protein
MALPEVNERSAARLTASFYDFDDALSAPSSITYAVYDLDTGTELRANTAVSPASTVTITLDSTDTQIIDDAKPVEVHFVVIKAVYAAGDEVNDSYRFRVKNLAHLSGT